MGFKLKIFIYLMIISCVIICAWWFEKQFNPGCDEKDKIELHGFLKGFCDDDNFTGYTDVYLDNFKLVFHRIDKSYLSNLVGYNVSLTCCRRVDPFARESPNLYYDLLKAIIINYKT